MHEPRPAARRAVLQKQGVVSVPAPVMSEPEPEPEPAQTTTEAEGFGSPPARKRISPECAPHRCHPRPAIRR